MIQRIQSIWLLLAAACIFAGFKLPVYTGVNTNKVPFEITATSSALLFIASIIIGTLSLILIFLFKNRTLQWRLCILQILLQALLIFLYYKEVTVKKIDLWQGSISLWAILQILSIAFIFMAAKGISNDKKLIKESDRLR